MYQAYRGVAVNQTSNGRQLRIGNILGTGTASGKLLHGCGCLLDVSKGGLERPKLVNGKSRTYPENGDAFRCVGQAGELTEPSVGFEERFGKIIAAYPETGNEIYIVQKANT